ERRVPGDDRADDADRLVEGEVEAPGADPDRLALDLVGGARPVGEHLGDRPDLPAPLPGGPAVVAALERRARGGPRRPARAPPPQQARALGRGEAAPGPVAEGTPGRLDGAIDVGGAPVGDERPDLGARRIDALDPGAVRGLRLLAVDPVVESDRG